MCHLVQTSSNISNWATNPIEGYRFAGGLLLWDWITALAVVGPALVELQLAQLLHDFGIRVGPGNLRPARKLPFQKFNQTKYSYDVYTQKFNPIYATKC